MSFRMKSVVREEPVSQAIFFEQKALKIHRLEKMN